MEAEERERRLREMIEGAKNSGAEAVQGVGRKVEYLAQKIEQMSFTPGELKFRLCRTAYWTLEQYLSSKRLQTIQKFVTRPLCEENQLELASYYSFKRNLFHNIS